MTLTDTVLIINAGSSSIKFQLFSFKRNRLHVIYKGLIEGIKTEKPHFNIKDFHEDTILDIEYEDNSLTHEDLFKNLVNWLDTLKNIKLIAIGHRVVHGGTRFSGPAIITDAVINYIESIIPMAPLHNPHHIVPMKILKNLLPNIPQIACFDTAFHRTMPTIIEKYALPREYSDEKGVIRYGMHGLSYEYISSTAHNVLPADIANGRLIVAHLGNGASMAAIKNGKSVATTMGFTPTDGLIMGTRCGSIDPGVLLYIMRNENKTIDELETLLTKESGLLGITQQFSDMRPIENSNDPRCIEAIDMFSLSIARKFGDLAVTLKGVDAFIFTAGIGEFGFIQRRKVCEYLTWIGIEINDEANNKNATYISTKNSKIPVLIMPTNEELMIAQHTIKLAIT